MARTLTNIDFVIGLLFLGALCLPLYCSSWHGPLVYDDTDAVELNQVSPHS